MPHTLFMDESGNAGINYLDADPPFHVVAGVLVDDERLSAFRRGLDSHLTHAVGEVKGSKLLRSPKGQVRALRALEELKRNATPFFVLMERGFALVEKIVDVFLDPGNQDAVSWLRLTDVDQRRALTDHLLESLPRATVEYFAKVYRTPTRDGIEGVLRLIVTNLDGQPLLRSSFEGALRSVDRIVPSETYGDETTKHGEWAGLNVPAFSHAVRLVDRYLDPAGTFRLVHDECSHFEPVLRRTLGILSRPDVAQPDFKLENGEVHRLFLRHCSGMEIGDSTVEIGLRAADVLASTVGKAAGAAIGSKAWTTELRALALATLRDLKVAHPKGGQLRAAIDASADTKTRIRRRLA